MENVQVLLLATGETNKLSPLTKETPSPMLPVVDRPVMLYAVESLARQGVKNVLVSLYHLAGNVESFFGQGQRWGIELEYLLQRDAWGTAGALKWAQGAISKTAVIIPADAIVDLDIAAIVAQHRQNKSMASVVVHQSNQNPSSIVCLNEANQLTATESAYFYSTGVYVFEPEIIDFIPERTSFDIHKQLLPLLMSEGISVQGIEIEDYWNPMISFQDYHNAQQHVLNSASDDRKSSNGSPALKHPSLASRQISPGIWVGRNPLIHPHARLLPPVYVGENCQVGSDVELGPDVVIGSNVVIDDEATVCHSTILDHTYVGQLVNIDRRFVDKNIVVDVLTAESTEVADYFLLDEFHTAILDSRLLRMSDFLFAIVLIGLTLFITIPLSIMLLLTTGHVFQRVVRVGGVSTGQHASARVFNLLRFYTRRENGRYTPLGRWVEQLQVHRLPELWHVLKGELRLVGVKPLSTEQMAHITEAWQQKRNDYYPGFTGMWYLQTDAKSSLDDILIADAYYVATRSWREDLKILKQTPLAWWRRLRS